MFIEIAIGNTKNRNIVIDHKYVNMYLKEGVELYRSFYMFDEKIKEHFRSGRKSPEGYIGNFYVNSIVIDYDQNKDKPEIMLEGCRDLVNYMIKVLKLEDNYRIFFSGTGFHIHIPNIFELTPSPNLPLELKATMQEYFKDFKIDYSIYSARSLIRVPFSYNEKSKLYKVYIPEDDFWTIKYEDIIEKAKSFNIEPIKPFNEVEEKFQIVAINKEKNVINPNIEPSNIVTCMQKMYKEGEVVGKRHIRVLRLASWLMRNGVPYEGALAMLKQYTPSLDPYELERTVLNVYEKRYMYGCDDEVMKEYCDSRCIFFNKKNYLADVFGTSELEKHYIKFVNSNILENAINLKWYFDIDNDFLLIPGNLIGLIGDTGINKSSLMQNLSIKFQDFGNVLYINTEMSNIELFERFMMIYHNMDREQVREYYKVNTNTLGNVISKVFYTNVTPTFDGLRDLVVKLRPSVIVIDVIDDIFTKNLTLKDEEYMYMELKNIARLYNTVIFMVHHLSKTGAKSELTKHSAKGSSAFEQKCDVILGLEGDPNTEFRRLKVLKGRSYPAFEVNLTVDNKYRFQQIMERVCQQ